MDKVLKFSKFNENLMVNENITFNAELEQLKGKMENKIRNIVDKKGIETEDYSFKCIEVSDDSQYNLQGNEYITHVHKDGFVSNVGNLYGFYTIDFEDFVNLVDCLILE